ncbi:glucose-6-phosphate isomerase [Yinghuangia seranimata]|uniref:glucose-6-phosphate isomerase n=1 Tax=Yinghuangia seranimata TaxID=408067 RepID=UPI00248CE60E|nr:glucose-6-phosphate isomerase [Yinghuangia seranimata]MDI2126322.1 glucose-6-phosphate isomerase [Yinghuangia seranimata]
MQHAFERVTAGGVDVTVSGDLVQATAVRDAMASQVADKVPARLTASDPTLWGPDAESEAAIRLGWVDLPASSRALLPQLAELRESVQAEGLDHVVLAGMGGSSLAPEVIAATYGRPLTVLDTTDADQVRRALADRVARTVIVVASKSGGTIETDSHRRAFEQAFRDAGLTPDQIAARIVVVTDPGSPLEKSAREAGYTVVLADPNVGGRYSALTAFGLVPSALAGVDVARLLDDAAALAPALSGNDDNPGLVLGAALGAAAVAGRDKLVLADAAGSGIVGFGDWAEQLIAESTGKLARGILPVVVEGTDAPGFTGAGGDAVLASTGDGGAQGCDVCDVDVRGPLGAQFLLWEYATAVAGRIIGIDPFDQPNVQESKDNTSALLTALESDGALPEGDPAFVDGVIAVYGDAALLDGATTAADAVRALLATVPENGYLAVMAYLDRFADSTAPQLRPLLAEALGDRQVTFGWAPRFLHSTGQFHKGGPRVGAFLQVTGEVTEDLPVAGRPYTFAQLQRAQALGDLGALGKRERPVLRLHLLDAAEGLAELLADVRALPAASPAGGTA